LAVLQGIGKYQMSERRVDTLIGAACFGAAFTGIIGIIAAIVSVVSMNLVGAGLAVIGASLAFGLLANALLRN